MTSDNDQWERITEGLGTEQEPFWQHVDNPNAISHDNGETYYLIDEPTEQNGSPRMYRPEQRPVPDQHYPKDLSQAVYMALGTASVAWTEDRVFDDVLARKAGEDLIAWINTHYDKKEAPSA